MVNTPNSPDSKSNWLNRMAWYVVTGLVVYVLSSGPMIGLAYWLGVVTHNGSWYAIVWIYYPLLLWESDANPVMWYVEWWVFDFFQAE